VLSLRPYQKEALASVLKHDREGIRRQLGVAPVAWGKTVLFAHLIRAKTAGSGYRALVLAHRDELISQAGEKICQVWPEADIGVVKAERNELDAQVILASVQTLARPGRLEELVRAAAGELRVVVSDEAHHSVSRTWKQILDRLGALSRGGPLHLGVTATPDRADKVGLGAVFEKIVFEYDMLWGIREGYLSDLRTVRVSLALDLDSVGEEDGDWEEAALGEALLSARAPEHAVRAWLEHGEGRKTLCFAASVALARRIAEEFQARGVPSGWLSGATPDGERKELLHRFRCGDLLVLVNCGVLTEGYDEPSIACVLLARPTRSRALFVQMIGRGTRRYPGKRDCLVIDLSGASEVHSPVSVASLFGLPPDELEEGRKSVAEAVEEKEGFGQELVGGRLVSREIGAWSRLREALFSWVAAGDKFALSVGEGLLVLEREGSGWRAALKPRAGDPAVLISGVSLELAQGVAEDWARRNARWLAGKDARWRKNPASERQAELLRRLGIPFRPGMTAGEASDLITAVLAAKR